MKALQNLVWLAAVAALLFATHALPQALAQQRAQYEQLVAVHAKANNVPEVLVHRVIVRESKYHPDLIGRGGTIGLMQIKLATARSLGYTGDAAGLRDPATNLAYGIKYLAGAWRAANSDHSRAMHYYASGYYYAAKRQRLERPGHRAPVLASAPPKDVEATKLATEAAPEPAAEAVVGPDEAAKPVEAAGKPIELTPKPVPTRKHPKKLADAKVHVPRPPALLSGANAAKSR